ncbi:unnamed protein product [Echinostoma caproni]|uniref:Phospholipid/glycerol acyltransferase domain-containing protein n=1 Tax=Echinostoma caproni TaxID=27848 RepID=A0A183BEC8_9TREM|nr:unnamed protein product [Echinostoma caproni]
MDVKRTLMKLTDDLLNVRGPVTISINKSTQVFNTVYPGYWFRLLIFPEGTDLNTSSLARSNQFARKNNLPFVSYTMHPRCTGFIYLVNLLGQGECFNVVVLMFFAATACSAPKIICPIQYYTNNYSGLSLCLPSCRLPHRAAFAVATPSWRKRRGGQQRMWRRGMKKRRTE